MPHYHPTFNIRFLESDDRDNFLDARPFSAYSRVYCVRLNCPDWLLGFMPFYLELGHSRYKPSSVVLYPDYGVWFFGDEIMPGKDKKDEKRSESFKGFINVPLEESDKEAIKAKWDKYNVGMALRNLVDTGKVSLSYNEKNNTYNCSVTFFQGDLAGYCVSSFANNAERAIFVTVYKFEHFYDQFPALIGSVRKEEFG